MKTETKVKVLKGCEKITIVLEWLMDHVSEFFTGVWEVTNDLKTYATGKKLEMVERLNKEKRADHGDDA